MLIFGLMDPDRAAAVDILNERLRALVSSRPIERLSPHERAGVIILTKVTMSLLNPDDMGTLLQGELAVDAIGSATWGPVRVRGRSSVELLGLLKRGGL